MQNCTLPLTIVDVFQSPFGDFLICKHIAVREDIKDWVRVEAEIKGHLAHQFTEAVINCQSDNDMKDLILSSILDHYAFIYTKSRKPHKVTRLMLDLLDEKSFRFYSPSPNDNSLIRSINHIIIGSGLFPTIYKIGAIWDIEGINEFIDYLIGEYGKFIPNSDHIYWVKKHYQQCKLEGKPWTFNQKGSNDESDNNT